MKYLHRDIKRGGGVSVTWFYPAMNYKCLAGCFGHSCIFHDSEICPHYLFEKQYYPAMFVIKMK